MATAIGLSMQLSASTSGLSSGLSEAERLIQKLGKGAESATKYFESFRDAASGQLPDAMQEIVDRAGTLANLFRDGLIKSEEFGAGIAGLSAEAATLTKAFQEGASITEKYRTEEEKRAATIERLGELVTQGAIDEATYARAMEEATGAKAEAQAAERELAAARAEAERIIESSMSAQEKYDAQIEKLTGHLEAGRLTQEQFDAAAAKAAETLERESRATEAAGDAADDAGLKLNELSGFFSLLPGPIGNVAGRISGFASTVSGIDKVLTDPTAAVANLSNVFALLTSPIGLAVAGVAAFTAAASAIASGLAQTSERVQQLGREADKIGASFGFIQTLEEAAKRSGSSVSAVGTSFKAFLQSVDEAKNGTGKASEAVVAAFQKIGISSEDLASKSPEELYKRVAEAVAGIEDPTKRAAVAQELLGKQGIGLIATFKSIPQTEEDLKRYFATLSDFDKIKFDQFDASVSALNTSTQGLGNALLRPFVGLGDGIAKGSAEFVGGITAIVQPIGQVLEPLLTNLGRAIELFLQGLGTIGRVIGAILQPVGTVFAALSEAFTPLNDGLMSIVTATQDAAVAFTEFVVSFTPIGLLAEYIDEIIQFMQPFVSAVVGGFQAFADIVSRVATIVQAAFQKVREYVIDSIGGVIESIATGVTAFLDFIGVGEAISAIGTAFSNLWDGIKSIVSQIGGFIESVLTFAEDWLGIKRNVEEPVTAELEFSTTEASLAATQFYSEITKAVERAADLGTEGVDAVAKYQEKLEEIAQLQAEGEYTQEEAKRAVEQTTAALDAQLKPLEEQAEARKKAADEAQKAADQQVEAERRVIEELEKQRKLEEEFGGNEKRMKAAEQLLAIDNERARVQKEINDAQNKGDQAAAAAASARLASLDQIAAGVQETASFGFNQQDVKDAIEKVQDQIEKDFTLEELQIAPDAANDFLDEVKSLEEELELKIIDPKQFDEGIAAARKLYEERKKAAEKIGDLENKLAEETAKIQEDRLDELGKKSKETLKATDIRTSEGAAEFLRLATGREDPAIEEYRKQIKKLDEIKKEIAKSRVAAVEIK